MTVREALKQAEQTLSQVPDPRIDAELLLSHVMGMERMRMRLEGAMELSGEQEQRFASLLLSRARRIPLQYLVGSQGFYGLEMATDCRALIPRQETEELCELGIAFLKKLPAPVALDLCTGSGAIAVALKHECPHAQVHAADISAAALSLARENAARNAADIAFHFGDLWNAVGELRFDLILSNPPYIPTKDCQTLQPEVQKEPRLALDGGADGLDFYRRIAGEATRHLLPGGLLAVEVGDEQAGAVRQLFESAGLSGVSVHQDLYGLSRMVSARFT